MGLGRQGFWGGGQGTPGSNPASLGISCEALEFRISNLPIVSIVVPFLGLTSSILRILKGNSKK